MPLFDLVLIARAPEKFLLLSLSFASLLHTVKLFLDIADCFINCLSRFALGQRTGCNFLEGISHLLEETVVIFRIASDKRGLLSYRINKTQKCILLGFLFFN